MSMRPVFMASYWAPAAIVSGAPPHARPNWRSRHRSRVSACLRCGVSRRRSLGEEDVGAIRLPHEDAGAGLEDGIVQEPARPAGGIQHRLEEGVRVEQERQGEDIDALHLVRQRDHVGGRHLDVAGHDRLRHGAVGQRLFPCKISMATALLVSRATASFHRTRLTPSVPVSGSWNDRRSRTGSAALASARPSRNNAARSAAFQTADARCFGLPRVMAWRCRIVGSSGRSCEAS